MLVEAPINAEDSMAWELVIVGSERGWSLEGTAWRDEGSPIFALDEREPMPFDDLERIILEDLERLLSVPMPTA